MDEQAQAMVDALQLRTTKKELAPLLSCTAWIHSCHYSWFVKPLYIYPSATQVLFLSLFDLKERAKLKELLGLTIDGSVPTHLGKIYLAHLLKKEMAPSSLLPELLLPPSPLNPLLELSKDELAALIDFLGLHDLAAELRTIVDRALISLVRSNLQTSQLQYLEYAAQQPMKWIPPKLHLEGWDREKKSLGALLHKRGLYRLAKALQGEHSSLQWHVAHRLDTGRGEYLMKSFAGKEDPAMITYFKGQVLHLLKGRP